MNSSVRRVLILIAFAVIGAYGLAELRGPQGLPALREKWDEIRQFEEENANLQRENDYRRDRIKKLEKQPVRAGAGDSKEAQAFAARRNFVHPSGTAQTRDSGRRSDGRSARFKIGRGDPAAQRRIQVLDCYESPP